MQFASQSLAEAEHPPVRANPENTRQKTLTQKDKWRKFIFTSDFDKKLVLNFLFVKI